MNTNIEFNANWDTSEFPDGGPNRAYIVRYWNILDDVYNNGETTSIGNIDIIDLVEVYPNPNSGKFSVRIQSSQAADVNLKLYNLQGAEIFTRTLRSVVDHRETIDEGLVKGLYFLSVESQSGVRTQKIIVK